ncbi:MAG TPA: RIO1 family regulatory kinase/ATPase [Ilumatobacteraceae bacterium]|nr:RIO1 family regulatory kinase/ATPase [Ilumatobacteraceae bacterium]
MSRFRYDDADDDVFADVPTRPRRPRRRSEPDTFVDPRLAAGGTLSTYPDAAPGPRPVPAWVVTSGDAIDTDRGPLKTGKEADVHLLERRDPATGQTALMAAKRYRGADHRLFHRDAGYLEGRRVRKSRETRAMANRTGLGRQLIAQQWAATEFATLGRLWSAGVPVPYPVQLAGSELLLELIGADGTAAPRLAEVAGGPDERAALWEQCIDALRAVGAAGFTHGDLSPYNVLVDDGRIVLIDLPQVVDIVINPQGREFLARDCHNLASWFARKGVAADADELEALILAARPG